METTFEHMQRQADDIDALRLRVIELEDQLTKKEKELAWSALVARVAEMNDNTALGKLEEWLWKDIENNHVGLEGRPDGYVCYLSVSSDSGLEPATTHADTLRVAIGAALEAVKEPTP